MKAFLLAAGLGTRLRPLTDNTPKCLLEVHGQPLLGIWLDALARAGVDEVLVNTHYLAEAVEHYLDSWAGPPAVRTSFEPELLGSAGTLLANRNWVKDDEMFLACNADNLTDFNVASLITRQRQGGTDATIAVFHAQRPSAVGIVEVDKAGLMVSFIEKPKHPASNLANAGMYAFRPAVLDKLTGPLPKDIGYDLLPRLVGRARTVTVEGYFRDIGDPTSYDLAQHEWQSGAAQ